MPQPSAPVTALAFREAVTPALTTTISASDWLTITPLQREQRAWETLIGIAVIGDWIGNQTADLVNWIRVQIGNFSGPTIPDKPIDQWFEEWWFSIFCEPLYWATNSSAGVGP